MQFEKLSFFQFSKAKMGADLITNKILVSKLMINVYSNCYYY